MDTAERRAALLKILCRRRFETIHNLAIELDVSERTIQRDIEKLSYSEPIYTQTGRYRGGVYVVDTYTMDRMYMTEEEIRLMKKILSLTKNDSALLSPLEQELLSRIIVQYEKPKIN